ncbi:MAG: Enoyl-CoA hydratase [Frankiales bacterium]|nr:Enoyl-CoA hydratase [Frankiales bacterium]
MSRYTQVDYGVEHRVATITLNRPERGNAFTHVMRRELDVAFAEADSDDDVRVVIVTGAGKNFCVGADLSGSTPEEPFSASRPGQQDARSNADTIGGLPRDGGGVVALRIAEMRKPVIAAINGAAVGVGVTMTLPMDVRICAESSRFGFVFARRGIIQEAASSWFLPRIVGVSQAMEWVATGRLVPAADARAARLVSRVVPDGELLDAARALAAEISTNTSGLSVAAARRMLWSSLSEPSPWTAHLHETQLIAELKRGPDAPEGVASFLEKRPPAFRGRVSTDLPALPDWPGGPKTTSTPEGAGDGGTA